MGGKSKMLFEHEMPEVYKCDYCSNESSNPDNFYFYLSHRRVEKYLNKRCRLICITCKDNVKMKAEVNQMTENVMYAPNDNERTSALQCSKCKECFHYNDEFVFFLNGVQVYVDEQYPDWDSAMCTTCADEEGLI